MTLTQDAFTASESNIDLKHDVTSKTHINTVHQHSHHIQNITSTLEQLHISKNYTIRRKALL